MSLVIKFYFTSSMLNMFRTLIHPSSGACDFSIVSPHWLCVLVSMFVGVSVWLGWGGSLLHGYHPNPASLLFFNYHNDARSNIHKIYIMCLFVIRNLAKLFLEL